MLLTHAHIDHAAGLPYYVSLRALYRLPPPKIYVPASAEAPLRDLLSIWTRLESDSDRCELVGCDRGTSSSSAATALRRCSGRDIASRPSDTRSTSG
ncbi:MAG: hypothetical protein HC923_11620 [Myxococcales bacterium]|nr:hypothetical protein [Myxococcales bacterium]